MDISTKLTAYKLSSGSPEAAAEWLRSTYSEYNHDPYSRQFIEYLLYRRNDKFINIHLALFAKTTFILERLYNKNITSLQLFVLKNANSIGIVSFSDLIKKYPSTRNHIQSLFSNEKISIFKLRDAVNKEGVFSNINNDIYYDIIVGLSNNKKIGTEYDGPMDGYAETSHDFLHEDIWRIFEKVPTTQKFTLVLTKIVEKLTNFPVGSSVVSQKIMLNRWTDPKSSKHSTHVFSDKFQLRKKISTALGWSTFESDDPALRHGFYETFAPAKVFGPEVDAPDYWYPHTKYSERDDRFHKIYDIIEKFYVTDGDEFFYSLLKNKNFWKKEKERELLSHIAWDIIKDPSYSMMAPNVLAGFRERFQEEHPEFFLEEEPEVKEEPDLKTTLEESIEEGLKRVGTSISTDLQLKFEEHLAKTESRLSENLEENLQKIESINHANYKRINENIGYIIKERDKDWRIVEVIKQEIFSNKETAIYAFSLIFIAITSVALIRYSLIQDQGVPLANIFQTFWDAIKVTAHDLSPSKAYAVRGVDQYDANIKGLFANVTRFRLGDITINQYLFIFSNGFQLYLMIAGETYKLIGIHDRKSRVYFLIHFISLFISIISIFYGTWFTLLFFDSIYCFIVANLF